MSRQSYDTDLTDAGWHLIDPFIPPAKPGGRPRKVNMREVVNGIMYLLRAGCAWRLLPHDFPKWQTVYYYFQRWQADGIWQRMHDALRTAVRTQDGRQEQPSAGVIDSQSVKTASAAQETGFDGGKRVKGRKRTILVDTMGLLLGACVHSAGRSDHAGLKLLGVFWAPLWSCLQLIWTDSTFGGKQFLEWVHQEFGWVVEVVKRPEDQKGFEVLPKRWVVERTFGWFGRYRRLSKDYEYLPTTSETMLFVAMIHVMLRRLTPVSETALPFL